MTYEERKKSVLTDKGIEQKAPKHREAAIESTYSNTLRQPMQAPSNSFQGQYMQNPMPYIENLARLYKEINILNPDLLTKWKSRNTEFGLIIQHASLKTHTILEASTVERFTIELQNELADAKIVKFEQETKAKEAAQNAPYTQQPTTSRLFVKDSEEYNDFQYKTMDFLRKLKRNYEGYTITYANDYATWVERGRVGNKPKIRNLPNDVVLFIEESIDKIELSVENPKVSTPHTQSPSNHLQLIQELGNLFKTIKLTRTQSIIDSWEARMPTINQLIQRIATSHPPLPEDIQTLKSLIADAREDIKDTAHERSEYVYEKKLKTKLTSFGTISPSEWDVVGFYSIDPTRQSRRGCQLCGHAIQNIYTIKKLTDPNKSTTLDIGSECVVNYLDVPINKVDFDLKYNPDKQFVSKINQLNSLISELTSRDNPDWGTRSHWEKRKELIDKYTKKFKEDQYLNDSQADKIIEELKHATEDISRIRKDIDEKRANHDSLKDLMASSIPFHLQNSFLKDIYTQWQNRRNLTDRQIDAFKNTLSRYLSPPTQDEPDGEHEVEGTPTDIRMTSIETSKGERGKIIFTMGSIQDISIVEWIKGYNILSEAHHKFKSDSQPLPYFHIKYVTKGRYRNVVDNGIQIIVPELPSDTPRTNISIFAPIVPRKWQIECFDKWWNQKIGVVQAGTGSGKTILAIMGIKKLLYDNPNATVIITVPTIELQRQWQSELIKSDITQSIGLIGGDGEKDSFGQITIGIYNSLRSRELKADMLIGDESHHLSDEAQQNFTIWAEQHFPRILFITATPGRIGEQVPIICKVSQDELQEENAIVKYSITNIPVELSNADYAQYRELTEEARRAGGFDTNYGKKLLGDRFRMVSNNPLKIQATVNLIKTINYNKAIVFFTTTAAVDYFYDIMLKEGVPISKIHSKMKKDERKEHYDAFASGRTRILVGAFAIGEGINLPSSDLCVITGGTSVERQFIQRVGRVLRVAPGKESAQVYQIFAKDTNEERWVKSRVLNVAKSTKIETLSE